MDFYAPILTNEKLMLMSTEPTPQQVNEFLSRVMEIEEKYAFAKKGQESARKDDLRGLLDDFCK